MRHLTFLLLCLIVSVLASVLALSQVLEGTEVMPSTEPPDRSRLAAIENRMAELERQDMKTQPPRVAMGAGGEPISASDARAIEQTLVRLSEQLAGIETRLAALEQPRARPAGPTNPQDLVARQEAARRSMVENQQTLVDSMAFVEDKIAAHRALRNQENAYTDAAVQELIHIGATHQDPMIRADVWRQFDGQTRLPAILPALMQALASDTDRRVREEAAETLGEYTDDPAVLSALRYAAQNDADPKVREQAEEVIKGK